MNISRVFHSTISNQALLISLPKRKGRKGKERLVSIFTLASSSRNWRGKVRTHFLFQEKVLRPRLLTHRVMLCKLYWICIFHSRHVYFMARPSTPPWHPRNPNLLHPWLLSWLLPVFLFSDLPPASVSIFTRGISPLRRAARFSHAMPSNWFLLFHFWCTFHLKDRVFFLPHCQGNWRFLNDSESGHILPYMLLKQFHSNVNNTNPVLFKDLCSIYML